ncbi:testicular acid phosphatase homolog [Diorhabda carinulata]|uniref:testicular acid phosphatase homolog n=1 Tax=Diorhabda carinulata TaxID=1163345 RepID=UPI0025A17A8A|nr:testicular acid phosphatase homolog [Diorhabda carinulata]
MVSFSQILFIICLTRTVITTFHSNENLVAVVQLFRHGHRTPVTFYTNDPYSDKIYWGGLGEGQLTGEGKRQQYRLGQFTRQRYGGWLPQKYDKSIFYARTTDVERTHMSALSNIYGLYPATTDDIWHPFSDWHPIPVHTADPKVFNTFPPFSCKSYYIERSNYLAGNESLAINEKYTKLYRYISHNSGENVTSLREVHNVYDCLAAEHSIGLPLPKWAKHIYPQPLSDLDALYFDSFSHTVKLQRLGTGTLLFEILKYFDDMTRDPTTSQKFQMFSGHDYNIAGVLNSLGAFNPPRSVPFASSIYFELRKNRNNTYYVNAWFKEQSKLKGIRIKGCEIDCPLDEVKHRLSKILIDVKTLDLECQENSQFISTVAKEFYDAFNEEFNSKSKSDKQKKI